MESYIQGLAAALKAAGLAPTDRFEVATKSSRMKARTFTSTSEAATWAFGRRDQDTYFGLNPIDPDATPPNGRCRDEDVARVGVLLIDCDPSDSSPGARAEAAALAEEVLNFLAQRFDVRPPLIDSGRGRQIWLHHEIARRDDHRLSSRKDLLRLLAEQFDRPRAAIDTTVANVSRLARLPLGRNSKTGERPRILDPGDGQTIRLDKVVDLVQELSESDVNRAEPQAASEERLPSFPVEALPEWLAALATGFAKATDSPIELALVPMLAVLATGLGPKWTCGTPTFRRSPLLWFCLVAPSGSGKTPAAELPLAPWLEHDVALRDQHKAMLDSLQEGEERPPRKRALVTDMTLPALVRTLSDSEGQGVLLHSDEIAALLESFDSQKRSRQDRANWLSLWSSTPIRAVRKTSRDMEVDRPFVGVLGGVQPSVLSRLELRDGDGLLSRFCWCNVKPAPHGLGTEVPELLRAQWTRAVGNALVAEGKWSLDKDAEEILDASLRRWSAQAQRLEEEGLGLQASLYAKAGDFLVRFTGLCFGLETACDPRRTTSPSGLVSAGTLRRAARLVDYFLVHGERAAELSLAAPRASAAGRLPLLAAALKRIVPPGETVTDSPANWSRRLEAEGIHLNPRQVGWRCKALSVEPQPSLRVALPPARARSRAWAVTHYRSPERRNDETTTGVSAFRRSEARHVDSTRLIAAEFNHLHPILNLVEQALGRSLVKTASTLGGEWHGPCPICGGEDRLRVHPAPPDGRPRAVCRKCGRAGDSVRWAMWIAGLDPKCHGATTAFLRG